VPRPADASSPVAPGSLTDSPGSLVVPRGLLAISALALLLNLAGLSWGLPARWHPDEKADVVLAMARERRLAPDSFINPSLPLYAMLPAIGLQDLLARAGWLSGTAADPLLAGRALSAMAGAAAVLALGLAVRRHAPSLGLVPPLLLAVFPAVVNVCHFATPEPWLLLGTVLVLWACLGHCDGRVSATVLGLLLGLTASIKYTAAALLAPALLAVWLRPREEAGRRDRVALGGFAALLLAAGLLLLGPAGDALAPRLRMGDVRLLQPDSARAFVFGMGRGLALGGLGLLVLAGLATRRLARPGVAGALPRLGFRCARVEVAVLLLAAAAGFVMGTPFAPLRPLAFLSDLAYNAQTRVEYKGLTGEATSFLPYVALLRDALTLPALAAAVCSLGLAAVHQGRKSLLVALAFVAPYLLVASSGHRALRFLAPAWPAAAWLAAGALASLRDSRVRWLATIAVVARAGAAALLVTRLFFVDSRLQAARFLEKSVPAGGTVDLIANHPGYAPSAPSGRTLRIVPTLSREMAPVTRFVEAARRYPEEASPWLVLTASFYERFLDHPEQQPERAAFFRDLLDGRLGFEVVARFRQQGWLRPGSDEFLDPEIVVLRKR
jgi:Dolichyl-phosphate-mannose-protein mannosyltransferase